MRTLPTQVTHIIPPGMEVENRHPEGCPALAGESEGSCGSILIRPFFGKTAGNSRNPQEVS